MTDKQLKLHTLCAILNVHWFKSAPLGLGFISLSVIDHEECESAERIEFFVGLYTNTIIIIS